MDSNKVDLEYDYHHQKKLGQSKSSWVPYKGSSRFSNSEAENLVDAIVYRCSDEKSANLLMTKLQDLDRSSFIRPRFLNQSEASCHVVGEKVGGGSCSLIDWCKQNHRSFWRVYPSGSNNVVSLGGPARKIFSQVLEGMNSYHKKDISHGNLKHGILITKENRVVFYNEKISERGDSGALSSDLLDFHSIVVEAVETISRYEKWANVIPPPSYDAFGELFGDMPVYEQLIDGIRRFEFLVRNNPFFLDITGSYLMFRKIYDYREYNCAKFGSHISFYSEATDLTDWYGTLTHPVLKAVKHSDDFLKTNGVHFFIRSIFGHAKSQNNNLDDGIITQSLMDGFPKLLPRLFLEVVREIDQNKFDTYSKNCRGYSPYEFMKMEPGFS